MQAPPPTGTPQGSEGSVRRGAEYLGQQGARRQLPPGAAYAPQHAPVPAPPQPPRLVESPVNYSRPLSVSPAPPPPPQQHHSNSAPPALHTRRSFIGPSHLASPSSSSSTPPAPSPNGAPSTRTAAASGMSRASQLPSFVPAVAFSPEDRGPYPPLASPTRELREPASAVADYLDAATAAAAGAAHGASSSAVAAPRVGLDDLDMAGVGTRASLILPASLSAAPTPSSSSGAPALLSPPRTGAPTPARSPQLVAASPYASAPSASAALVSASASPVGAPPPLAPPANATQAQAYAAPPGAPPPPKPPQPPPHLVPQPEVCVECMMRDRDMADVDVTGARVWERDSDAEWDEQCRWEDQVELLGSGAGAGSGSGHEAHGGGNGSSESGAGVRRSVYERDSSSAHTGAGAGAGAGGRRRLGKGQLLTSGNLKVWTTMNPPAAAHRWRTLQTFLATQAHYLELDRQARIREASAAAAAAAVSSSPHGPSPHGLSPIEHLPAAAAAASNQQRNRASSLLSPESLAAEKAALEHEERVALRAIKSRSRATLADETNLHQHQHQLAGGNQSFRHSSASLLPPPSLYNGAAGGNGGGNASSGSSMRSYSAGDQPWLGPTLRRLSSPSAAGAPVGAGGASQLSASPPKSPATSMASSRFAFPKFARSSTDLRSLPPGTGGGATPRSVSPARTSGDGSARRPTSMWSRFRQSASAASVLSFAPSGSMMDMHLGLEQDQRAGLAAAGGPGYGSLGHYGGGGAGGGGAAMYAAQHGAGAGAGYGFGSPQQAVYDAYGAAAMSDPAVARHADRRERERVLAETAAAREAAAAAAAAEAEHGAGKKKKKGLKGFLTKLVGGGGGRARSRTLGSSSAPATPGVDRGAPFDASLGPSSRYGADDDELAPPPPLSALANEPRYHLRSGSSSSVDSLGPYTPPLPPQQQFRQSYHMPMPGGGAHAADRQSVLTLGSFTSTRSNGGGGGGNKPSSGAGARASTVPSRNSWVGRPSLDSVRRPGSFGGGPALGGGGGGPGDAETEVLAGGVDDLDLEPEQQHGDDEHELLQPPPHPRSQKSLPLLPSEATYRGSPSPHGASSPYDPYHAARAGPPAGYDAPPAPSGPYANYGASRSAYTLGSSPAADSRTSLAQEFGLVGGGDRDQGQQHTVRKSRSRHKVFSLSFGSNSGKKGQHRQSSAEVGPPPPPPLPSGARGASLDSSSVMRYAEAYDERPQGEALVGGMR